MPRSTWLLGAPGQLQLEQFLEPPTAGDIWFVHSALCSAHFPRSGCELAHHERIANKVILRIERGSLAIDGKWVQQEMPSGALARLLFAYICTSAIKTKSRSLTLESSSRQLLLLLGRGSGGGQRDRGGYRALERQLDALLSCRILLGFSKTGEYVTADVSVARRIAVWRESARGVAGMPRAVELSEEFFKHLQRHAVPVDKRALIALGGSAWALDVYTFVVKRLAYLNRSFKPNEYIRWRRLHFQFCGTSVGPTRDFKARVRESLARVQIVYPMARVSVVRGGLLFEKSPPPVSASTASEAVHN